jgi:SAM-dependent methyltransferase
VGPSSALADIEVLPYPDNSFDTVTAACVFCSVGDPVRGLREAARVVRRDGQVLLYEHVRPHNPILGKLADLVSPLTRRLLGPELNRPTEQHVQTAGLRLSEVRRHGHVARDRRHPARRTRGCTGSVAT